MSVEGNKPQVSMPERHSNMSANAPYPRAKKSPRPCFENVYTLTQIILALTVFYHLVFNKSRRQLSKDDKAEVTGDFHDQIKNGKRFFMRGCFGTGRPAFVQEQIREANSEPGGGIDLTGTEKSKEC
ncbi:unnamed protein product [Clavelina lepadiformis]|uniref:Uncharacterized protein n=1 Tax=Clavelina lepadiformis TaxID=159417 RepID=A0ABP0G9Y3_CLALP